MNEPIGARLPSGVREQLDTTIEHFNGNHADTVLFMARHCGGVPAATDAEAVDVDRDGVVVDVVVDGDTTTTRLPFSDTVATVPEVQGQVIGLIATARQAAGESEPLTSIEREIQTTANLTTRITEVASVGDLSPNLRRIVVQGGLGDWEPLGADDFAFLFVPRSSGDDSITEGFSMTAWQGMAEDDRPYGAYYTIRRFDPEARTIELWAVLHGHDTGIGGWAARAQVGDRVALWGPRSGFEAPVGVHHHLFVADESGLAAVGALLDGLDPEARVTIVAETVDADHEITIAERPGTEICWLHRGEIAPGRSAGFVDRVAAIDFDPATTVAFGAGESHQVTALRKYLRHELGMPSDRVFMTGYWRR